MAHWDDPASARNAHRPFLAFNVVPLCRKAAAAILQVHANTLRSLQKHAEDHVNPPADGRSVKPGLASSEPRQNTDLLLTWVHQFLAEPLAESVLQKENDILPLKSLVDSSSLAHAAKSLDQRWLPSNTTLVELLETAWSFANLDGQKPSYSTWVRVWHEDKWNKILKFRGESQHAHCTECEKLKQFRRVAFSKHDTDRVSQAYHQHLSEMIMDRQVDARINAHAAQCMQGLLKDEEGKGSLLSCTIDSMDTAKFKLPRNFNVTKFMENMHRPECKMTCVLTEGMSEHYFLWADHTTKDSNASLTLLTHSLSESLDHMKKKGLPMPREYRVHADNAPGEVKNQVSLKWSAFLMAAGYFDKITWSMFAVGHSHSKIDQRFSEVRRALSAASVLQVSRQFFLFVFTL